MFGKVLFIFAGLFVQEIISLNALIFATHHGLYSPMLIHLLFVVATIFDIIIGFFIGIFLRKKTCNTRVTAYIQKLSDRFALGTKKYRRWLVLLLLGNFSFPYINSCIAGYLDMPFWESSLFIFIGDIVWYATIWLVVLGISSVVKNLYIAFIVVIIIGFLSFIFLRKINVNKLFSYPSRD